MPPKIPKLMLWFRSISLFPPTNASLTTSLVNKRIVILNRNIVSFFNTGGIAIFTNHRNHLLKIFGLPDFIWIHNALCNLLTHPLDKLSKSRRSSAGDDLRDLVLITLFHAWFSPPRPYFVKPPQFLTNHEFLNHNQDSPINVLLESVHVLCAITS